VPSAPFARTIEVSADTATCWSVLTDVQRVAGWVSFVGSVAEHERLRSYAVVLEDRMGLLRLRADVAVEVTDRRDRELLTLRAEGEDRQVGSRIRVDATLRLAPVGTGATVTVDGTYEVTGPVAALGAAMIHGKAKKLLDEFFRAAARELS
jgi:carbon monoxide dehydrogenase subunit G